MGALNQSPLGYGTIIPPVYFVIAHTVYDHIFKAGDSLFPSSQPATPAVPALLIAHSTVPLAPSKVTLDVPPPQTTLFTPIAIVTCICIVLVVGVLCFTHWSIKCATMSKGISCQARSSPSLHSSSARGDEPVDDEADSDDLDYTPSGEGDDEADGDDDDYLDDDMDGGLDELEEEEVEDLLSPSEDPPPPPDPPSQTDAADTDPKPKLVPWWYLILMAMFTVIGFSLVKWAFLRLRRTLSRTKIYTGVSLPHLYTYVDHPTSSPLVPTTAISLPAGTSGIVAPFRAGDLSIIKQTVGLSSTTVPDVLLLRPMLTLTVVLAPLLAFIVIELYWRTRVRNDGQLEPLSGRNADDVPGIEEVDMRADVVKEPSVSVSDLIEDTTIQLPTPESDDHEVEIALSSLPITGVEDDGGRSVSFHGNARPSFHDQEDYINSTESLAPYTSSFCLGISPAIREDRIDGQVGVSFELDLSIIPHLPLPRPGFGSVGMASLQEGAGSFMEEIIGEGLGDASFVLQDSIPAEEEARISRPSAVRTVFPVWRGECIVLHTPRRILPLIRAAVITTPARSSGRDPYLPLLPKRVSELRDVRHCISFTKAILHSTPNHVRRLCRSVGTTVASPSRLVDQTSVTVSDSDTVSAVFDELLSYAGEVEQSTLVEENSCVAGKANVAPRLEAVDIEVAGVVVDCDSVAPKVVDFGVEEKENNGSIVSEPRIDEEEDAVVIVGEEQSFAEERAVHAVDEKPTEGTQNSTLIPAPSCLRKEFTSSPTNEEDELIDFVDGAGHGVYRYFIPHLALYQPLSPVSLAGPAVPTSLPSVVYCPCCPDEELEWDELSMVDDALAELRCFDLPYGIGEEHLAVAARDDIEDLKDDGVDLTTWAVECVVIEDEVENVESQLWDWIYEVEEAVWMKDSVEDDDGEEEEEVEMELLAGPLDDSMNEQDTGNETLNLSEILMDLYGPDGSKAELLTNVTPPDFDAADIFDIFDDFLPVWENVFRSTPTPTTLPAVFAKDLCAPLHPPTPVSDEGLPSVDLPASSLVIATAPVLGGVSPPITLDPIHSYARTPDLEVNTQADISSPTDNLTLQPSGSGPSTGTLSKRRSEPDHIVLAISADKLSVVEAKRSEDGIAGNIQHEDIQNMEEDVQPYGHDPVDADPGKIWSWRRVTSELQELQSKEDHRWQLRPDKTIPCLATPEPENELQRMRARLRPPQNMTEQDKRVRQIWSMQGTEKGRVLKEQRSRKAVDKCA